MDRTTSIVALCTAVLITTACGESDTDGVPAPTVALPDCDGPLPVLDDSEWPFYEAESAVSFWIDGRFYIHPGSGLVRRVPAQQLAGRNAQLATPAIGSAGTAVLTQNGPAILFDVGSGVTAAVYAYQLRTLMSRLGARTISHVHISHLHADHYDQLARVVETYRIPARNIIVMEAMVRRSPGFQAEWRRIAANPRLRRLGYTDMPAGIDPLVESRTIGYVRARFQQGEVLIEYTANRAAIENLDRRGQMDAASAIQAIRPIGEIRRFINTGDLRGSDIADIYEAVGDREFRRIFRGVEMLHGFQHHLGVVRSARDVEGLMHLIRATAGQSGRLEVIVQTNDRQMRTKLVEALNHLGIDVTAVLRGSAQAPSAAIAELGRGVRRIGPDVTFHGTPDANRLIFSRLHELREYQIATARNRRELSERFGATTVRGLDAALAAEIARVNALLDARAELTLQQLLGGRARATRAINDRAEFALRPISENVEAVARPGAEQEILRANGELRMALDRLVRARRIEAELSAHVQAALQRGSTSPRLLQLIELLEPGLRGRLAAQPPRRRQEAHRHLRDALLRAELERAGMRPGPAPAPGWKRGVTGVLAAAELGRIGIEFYELFQQSSERQKADALTALFWWRQRGVSFGVTAVDSERRPIDSADTVLSLLSQPVYTLTDQGIRRLRLATTMTERELRQLEFTKHGSDSAQAFLARVRDRLGSAAVERHRDDLLAVAQRLPADAIRSIDIQTPDAEGWFGFLLWVGQNVQDLDHYQRHFREGPLQLVRHVGTNFPNGEWNVRIWTNGSPMWVEDAQFTTIMRRVGARVVAETERKLADAWRRREAVVPRLREPSIMAAPDVGWEFFLDESWNPLGTRARPTGRARFRAGASQVVYSYLDKDEIAVSRFGSSSWWTPQPWLLVFENLPAPEGHVVVSGADYNTYGSIRTATIWQFDDRQTVELPVPAARDARHARLIEDLGRNRNARFVASPAGDFSGIIRYFFRGPNLAGLAFARVNDLDIERIAPESEAPSEPADTEEKAFGGPPDLICSTFEVDAGGWRMVKSTGADAGPATHAAIPDLTNGYLEWSRPESRSERQPLDLVMVFDLTGSMQPHIDQTRAAAAEIVSRLRETSGDVRLGLVGFRDHEDNPGTARQLHPLSARLDERLAEMNAWIADGGGDTPEDLLHALDGALSDAMQWRRAGLRRQQVVRVVVIVTDAPAKRDTAGRDFAGNTFESIITAARARGAQLHAIALGNGAAADARVLAAETGGTVHAGAEARISDALLASAEAGLLGLPHYWIAPPKYLGDRARYIGSMLGIDRNCSAEPDGRSGDEVVLRGAGLEARNSSSRMAREDALVAGQAWARYSAALDSTGGWQDAAGAAIGNAALGALLGSLESIRIRADYVQTPVTCTLDNVYMGGLRPR